MTVDQSASPALTVGARIGYLATAGDAVDRDGNGDREANTTNF